MLKTKICKKRKKLKQTNSSANYGRSNSKIRESCPKGTSPERL